MAIQNRRGPYNKFDPQKMLPGEWAVVLEGDVNATDGRAAYMCFAAGDVKRMATYEDMVDNIREASGEAIDAQIDSKLEETLQEMQTGIATMSAATQEASNAAGTAGTAAENADQKASDAAMAASAAQEAAQEAGSAADEALQAAEEAREAAAKVTISDEDMARIKAQVLLAAHPVGSIYVSNDDTDPGELFGGTWEQITDVFLLASGEREAGETGGEKEVTLAIGQMPSHNHAGPSHTHTLASHSHTASSASNGAHTHNVDRNQNAASGSDRYAAQYAAAGTTTTTSSAGAHTHTITVNGSGQLTTGAAGTGNTGSAGSGEAHNNMPPYRVVNVWERTA